MFEKWRTLFIFARYPRGCVAALSALCARTGRTHWPYTHNRTSLSGTSSRNSRVPFKNSLAWPVSSDKWKALLVSDKTHCWLCSKAVHVNSSRISKVVVYDESKGTFLASKIPKVCTSKKCHFTQHYGYYTVGNCKFFDEDWKKKIEPEI